MMNFLLYILCHYKIARVDLMLFFQEKLAVVHIYLPHHLFFFLFFSCCVFTNFSLLVGSSLIFTRSLTSLEMRYTLDNGCKLASSTIQ